MHESHFGLIEPTASKPAPKAFRSLGREEEGSVVEGRKVRVLVRTRTRKYVGDLFVPATRKSVLEMVNDDQRRFVNLTNVLIDETQRIKFISLNKRLIESIAPQTSYHLTPN